MTVPENKNFTVEFRQTYTCEALSTLCIDMVTKDFSSHTRKMRYLPYRLKNRLFQIACQRDKVLENVDVLSSLLHANIKEIDFTNCDLTSEMLEKVSESCHNIEKLYMICNSSITKKAMNNLIVGKSKLRVLRAKNCPSIDDDFIKNLVKHCTLLKILDIANCNITEGSLQDIGRLRLTALNISNVIVSDSGMNDLLSGECKFTLRELIVCCSRNYGNNVENDFPNLTIFVNKRPLDGDHLMKPGNLRQLSWVVH